MTTKEKSEKAWKVKADEFDSNFTTTKSVMTEAYLEGIADYKASLREAIEKRRDRGTFINSYLWTNEELLELLDKVTPTDPLKG